MTSIEILIDGQRLDLDSKAKVSFEIISPIFSDLKAIGSNYSYTISAPATPTNDLLFDFANAADSDGSFWRTKHAAALYICGVEIFGNGIAYMTSADDDAYNITLVWGVPETLTAFWDKKLTDVCPELNVVWDGGISYIDSILPTGYGFARYISAPAMKTTQIEPKYTYPIVSADKVLDLLAEGAGIAIDKTNITSPYTLPCVTNNGNEASTKAGAWSEFTTEAVSRSYGSVGAILPITGYLNFTNTDNGDPDSMLNSESPWRLQVNGDYIGVRLAWTSPTAHCIIRKTGEADTIVDVPATASVEVICCRKDDTVSFREVRGNDFYFKRDKGDVDYINLRYTLNVNLSAYLVGSVISVAITFSKPTIHAFSSFYLQYPGLYPISSNLPDLTCGEFIGSLCNMMCVRPYVTAAGALAFAPITSVDVAPEVNWSSKYVSTRRLGNLSKSQLANKDFGQTSECVYSDGDEYPFANGSFEVANETLDRTKQVVKLPYVPTRTVNDLPYIPIFDEEKTEDGITSREYKGIKGQPILTDETFSRSQWFDTSGLLSSENWSRFIEILGEWRLITVSVDLSPIDLANLNILAAVRIDALGGRFLLNKISYTSGEFAEVELLKI